MVTERKPFHADVLQTKLQDALTQRMAAIDRKVDLEKQVGNLDRARNDFEFYYKALFTDVQPNIFPWGPHQHFAVRFITWQGWEGIFPSRRIVIMPPGTGKSNIVSKAFASWMVGRHYDLPVCLVTSKTDLAIERSLYLREFVAADELWKSVFPGVTPYPIMWRTEQWTLVPRNDQRPKSDAPSFRAAGTDSSIGGVRIWGNIIDDAHNFTNSRTPGERARIKDWYDTQLVPRLSGMEGDWQIILANIWHGDDLTSTLWRSGEYAVMHMMALYENREVWCDVSFPRHLAGAGPALADWCGVARDRWVWREQERQLRMVIHLKGPSIWPDKLPRAELERQRRQNRSRFERVYNGRANVEAGVTYKRDWFKYWNWEGPPAFKGAQQVWDTASEVAGRSDPSAGVLQYIGEDGDVYLAGIFRAKMESGVALPLAVVAWYLVARLDDVPVNLVLIEQSAYARSSIQRIKRGWDRDEFLAMCRKYLSYADAIPALVKLIRRILQETDRLPDVIKLPLRPIKVKRTGKAEVHEDTTPYYEGGNVWHLESMEGLNLLEAELTNHPDGEHDDIADANAHGITFHFGVRKPRQDKASSGGHMIMDLSPVVLARNRPTGLTNRVGV